MTVRETLSQWFFQRHYRILLVSLIAVIAISPFVHSGTWLYWVLELAVFMVMATALLSIWSTRRLFVIGLVLAVSSQLLSHGSLLAKQQGASAVGDLLRMAFMLLIVGAIFADIMRAEKRNPVASQTVTVQDAILIMTRAKAGCVSVVNKSGKLVGVFTDGDLRRHMSEDPEVLEKPLSKLMTKRSL